MEFVVPISIKQQYVGALIAGQIRLSNNEMDRLDFITKQSEQIFDNTEILDAYNSSDSPA